MHASKAKAKKHYGIDINRYLGVELPEDHIPASQHSPKEPQHRSSISSFAFRDSLTKMYSSTTNKSSSSIRRWNSKSSTPLIDRSNTQKSGYTNSTANTSSFLPELYSTPPMPTFQKPDMPTSTPLRKTHNQENETPTRNTVARRPGLEPPTQISGPTTSSFLTIPNRSLISRPVATTAIDDRVGDTPPLPVGWSQKHDRAICVLDARNYSLPAIVSKMRRTFPELRGTMTPAMVDKRLRQLDQNVEIDYWRIGLRKEEKDRNRTLSPLGSTRQGGSSMTLTDEVGLSSPEGSGKKSRSPP